MSSDLDTLLHEAGGDPATPLDTDATWTKGRRRRLLRRASAASGGLAGVAVLALVATSVLSGGAGPAVPEIEPMSPPVAEEPEEPGDEQSVPEPDPPGTEDPVSDAEETTSEDPDTSVTDSDSGTDPAATDPVEEAPSEPEVAAAPETTDADVPSGPEPDWGRTPDPCAVHDDGQMRAFIDVVSPVNGQQVDGAVALVGCSSVFEGTIRYRLSQGGEVLVNGFTTATAGGPELGEFRQGIALTRTGTHTLEVFWDSPKDGEGEQDLTTITFEAG